jgi:hypothetical protein
VKNNFFAKNYLKILINTACSRRTGWKRALIILGLPPHVGERVAVDLGISPLLTKIN